MHSSHTIVRFLLSLSWLIVSRHLNCWLRFKPVWFELGLLSLGHGLDKPELLIKSLRFKCEAQTVKWYLEWSGANQCLVDF